MVERTVEFIVDSSHMFKDGFIHIILTLFAKDPCKKCLVKACCSDICEHKIYYLNFCDIDGSIWFDKACAGSIIFSCIMIIVAIYNIIF